MSRKVVTITHSANKYDILSQTPKNYNKDNYFLKELQDKVNAEWNYRPNRVDVEYETDWGQLKWSPIEVVVQTVLSEKGQNISNDTRKLVFKNILENRFNIGSRFRMSEDYDISKPDEEKNVWLVTNQNKVNMTSSVVVERCNGTLGSVYNNGDGTVSYHYEPVIQGKDLTGVNFSYNETLISPQSQLLIIAQHNEFTAEYYINQRFIIGYDKVYRIKAINKFYGNTTYDSENIGLIRIYMEICEDTSEYDDFTNRIAYNSDLMVHVQAPQEHTYTIQFLQPFADETSGVLTDVNGQIIADIDHNRLVVGSSTINVIPETGITFEPVLQYGFERVDAEFSLKVRLINLSDKSWQDLYIKVAKTGKNLFEVTRLRDYINGNVQLIWSVTAPDGKEYQKTLEFYMTEQ